MSAPKSRLTAVEKQALLAKLIESHKLNAPAETHPVSADMPESFYRIEKFPRYHQMQLHRALADKIGLKSPFFTLHEGIGRDTALIGGRKVLNFSTYNYLGLNGDPRVNEAALAAAEKYGTSASASRIVGGERPPHRALERALADLHGVEDAIAFVSGFGANVALVSTLVGPKDLVLLDRLVHNSIIQGAKLSDAAVQTFAHNDWQALDTLLASSRARYERVLIVVEGIYSMEGDICPLDRLVDIKKRHRTLLMVDEAHSVGALGRTGRGIGEYCGVPADAVDVWMGTLSKSFAGCGGYAAGSAAMVELMKFTAPGFVYSVGMPPPMAAAAACAIEIMLAEPERIARLAANGRHFLDIARAAGLNTGISIGLNIVPVILGSSVLAARLSNALLAMGVAVNPIVYPAVEEKQARLRFFLSADHTPAQLDAAIQILSAALADV